MMIDFATACDHSAPLSHHTLPLLLVLVLLVVSAHDWLAKDEAHIQPVKASTVSLNQPDEESCGIWGSGRWLLAKGRV